MSARKGKRRVGQLQYRRFHAAFIWRSAEVIDMAQRVLGTSELAEKWLNLPAVALDGQTPPDMFSSTLGIESVKELLTRIEYGVYL